MGCHHIKLFFFKWQGWSSTLSLIFRITTNLKKSTPWGENLVCHYWSQGAWWGQGAILESSWKMNSVFPLNIFSFIVTLDYKSLWKSLLMTKFLSHLLLYFPRLPEISVGLIDPSMKMKTGKYKRSSFEMSSLCNRKTIIPCRWASELVQAQVLYFWLLNGLDESHIHKAIWIIISILYVMWTSLWSCCWQFVHIYAF